LEEGLIIVAILSHGDEGKILGTDGSTVQQTTLLRMFSEPALAEKPKLFIFVQCRYCCQSAKKKKKNIIN
jgi:hypothetical protein